MTASILSKERGLAITISLLVRSSAMALVRLMLLSSASPGCAAMEGRTGPAPGRLMATLSPRALPPGFLFLSVKMLVILSTSSVAEA